MPIHPNVKVCTHLKVTGVRCGSPALRGEQFCYFHERMTRGVQVPPNARLHPVRFATVPGRVVHQVPDYPAPTKTGPRGARNNHHGSRDRNRPSPSDRIRQSDRSHPPQAPSQRPGTSEAAEKCSPRLTPCGDVKAAQVALDILGHALERVSRVHEAAA